MQKIDTLIKNATLSKDKVALNAYKNLKAEFEKYAHAQILTRRLTEDVCTRITVNYCKKLEDAILQFFYARRDDLVFEYTSELEVLRKLLPEPVNESEIYDFIESDENFFDKFWVTLENENDSDWQNGGEGTHMELHIPKKEMKNAINFLKKKFPTTDGKIIAKIVKKYVV